MGMICYLCYNAAERQVRRIRRAPAKLLLDREGPPEYNAARMENANAHIDLSTLDIAAMQSRLSELGSYL